MEWEKWEVFNCSYFVVIIRTILTLTFFYVYFFIYIYLLNFLLNFKIYLKYILVRTPTLLWKQGQYFTLTRSFCYFLFYFAFIYILFLKYFILNIFFVILFVVLYFFRLFFKTRAEPPCGRFLMESRQKDFRLL